MIICALVKHELMHISAPVSVTTNSLFVQAHLAIKLFLILILILHVLL